MSAEGGGLSAAKARSINKRVKREPLIAPPAKYNIRDGLTTLEGLAFKAVAALCPKISGSTLKRRLDKGERDLAALRKRPDKPKRHNPKPMLFGCKR
jgi:hypothetical protein